MKNLLRIPIAALVPTSRDSKRFFKVPFKEHVQLKKNLGFSERLLGSPRYSRYRHCLYLFFPKNKLEERGIRIFKKRVQILDAARDVRKKPTEKAAPSRFSQDLDNSSQMIVATATEGDAVQFETVQKVASQ